MTPKDGAAGKERPASTADIETYNEMRGEALATTAEQAGTSDRGDAVYGVVVDLGLDEGAAATVVGMADGSASMHASTGGGVVGAGERPEVAAAARTLVAEADSQRAAFGPGWKDRALEDGEVRIIALTPSGSLAVTAMVDDLMEDDNPLRPLFMAVNHLIYRVTTIPPGD